jgi:succinate-acetate transporter protein
MPAVIGRGGGTLKPISALANCVPLGLPVFGLSTRLPSINNSMRLSGCAIQLQVPNRWLQAADSMLLDL